MNWRYPASGRLQDAIVLDARGAAWSGFWVRASPSLAGPVSGDLVAAVLDGPRPGAVHAALIKRLGD